MINKNVADYTNFDGKTNKRIVQAPGGLSSISLGWGDSGQNYNQYEKKSSQYQQYANEGQYGAKYGRNVEERYDEPMNVMGGYGQRNQGKRTKYEQTYEQQNSRQMGQKGVQIGGQYGYNNYNIISGYGNDSYGNSSKSSQYQRQQIPPKSSYNQMNDQANFYKPSTNTHHLQMDRALEEQTKKVESSRGQRNQQKTSSNSVYENKETRPCVKIHQQQNNNIFGGDQYDYWKQDGHLENQKNSKKDIPYYHERSNGQSNNRNDYNIISGQSGQNEKTSVKVHNPPGGRSNFIFG